MTGSLCKTFLDLAAQTTRRINAAHANGMRWSEESNTEHLLLTLCTQYPDQIEIASFSKRREAANGADWEWWFVGPAGAYGMRVQAKRIKLPSEVFSHLRHRPKAHARDQMTSLIQEAVAEGLMPTYCFYVASRNRNISGCLVGHAQVIQQARSSRLGALTPYLIPWHRLVCTGAGTGNGDISETAELAMREAAHRLPTSEEESTKMPFLPGKHERLPSYVTDLLEGSSARHQAMQPLQNVDDLVKAVRGIVVFRSSEEAAT